MIDGFRIANVLNSVQALDLQRSDYQRYPDDYFFRQGGARFVTSKRLFWRRRYWRASISFAFRRTIRRGVSREDSPGVASERLPHRREMFLAIRAETED